MKTQDINDVVEGDCHGQFDSVHGVLKGRMKEFANARAKNGPDNPDTKTAGSKVHEAAARFQKQAQVVADNARNATGGPTYYDRTEPAEALALARDSDPAFVVDGFIVTRGAAEALNRRFQRNEEERLAAEQGHHERMELAKKMVRRAQPSRADEAEEEPPHIRYEFDPERKVHVYRGVGGILKETKATDGPLSEAEVRALAAKEGFLRSFASSDDARKVAERTAAREARKKQAEDAIRAVLKQSGATK